MQKVWFWKEEEKRKSRTSSAVEKHLNPCADVKALWWKFLAVGRKAQEEEEEDGARAEGVSLVRRRRAMVTSVAGREGAGAE
jgi:hypothetical protein